MTTSAERPPRSGPGLVGPVVLVGLGAVLLLNTMGLLGWDVWDTLFRLWPLLLIAAGLELMLGRRSSIAPLLIALGLIVAFGLAIWWAGVWPRAGAPRATTTIAQPLDGAARAEVELMMGVGELRLAAMDEPDGLIAGSVRSAPGMEPRPNFALRDGVARYTLRAREGGRVPGWDRRGFEERWDLRLNPEIPLRLTLSAGVGATSADLAALRVSDLQVNSGVGQIEVTLPRAGSLDATINGGVGQTVVIIPRGAIARIEVSRGLGGVEVQGDYERSGNVYTAPGYGQADERIDLKVNGGVGGITIRAGGE